MVSTSYLQVTVFESKLVFRLGRLSAMIGSTTYSSSCSMAMFLCN